VVIPDVTATVHRDLIIAFAAQHRLPAVYYLAYRRCSDTSRQPKRLSTTAVRRPDCAIRQAISPAAGKISRPDFFAGGLFSEKFFCPITGG
jgi:hypothetical protein